MDVRPLGALPKTQHLDSNIDTEDDDDADISQEEVERIYMDWDARTLADDESEVSRHRLGYQRSLWMMSQTGTVQYSCYGI